MLLRKLIPLLVVFLAILGCGKKADDAGGGGDPAPSGPPVTIKIRKEQQGDKVTVTESGNSTTSTNGNGPKGKIAKQEKTEGKVEYTETVIEKPEGADRATKAKREYKGAEKGKNGPPKPLSYANKTVLI